MKNRRGWKQLAEGYPWFVGDGRYPIPAYSEFMPPPRPGLTPYGEVDSRLFCKSDPFGWRIPEFEEEYELRPGLENICKQILDELVKLGGGAPAYRIAGHKGANLQNNPYWPPLLAARAGHLHHERYVILLPLALSKTQDDQGRVRWTLFGSSEQGPERAFWKSFFSSPGREIAARQALSFFCRLLKDAYGEKANDPARLGSLGFRILPSDASSQFPYENDDSLPTWTKPLIIEDGDVSARVRYLLTFKPFARLAPAVQEKYLAGKLALLPFPGSLVFWGIENYLHLREQLPMAMQMPLLRLIARHDAPYGIRVPQSGWLHQKREDEETAEIHKELLLNTYRRTSRWDRVARHEDAVAVSSREHKVTDALFCADLDCLNLYDKPMARNSQIWSEECRLLLDGPAAGRKEIDRAATTILEGGLFRYRFQFPPMQVGVHAVYWHRPLAAYWSHTGGKPELLPMAPLGYLTAYQGKLSRPVELWPRLLCRKAHLSGLQLADRAGDHYRRQTSLNVLRLLDSRQLWGRQLLPRSFARQLLRIPEEESMDQWLGSLPVRVRRTLMAILAPPDKMRSSPKAATFPETATREFERAYWQDMLKLSHGRYTNKANADPVLDPVTQDALTHRRRDLESLGDYLISRHREAMASAGMQERAICGDIPFSWRTDFDFPLFGGWKSNVGRTNHERNILLMIPGKNRKEAVIMADHYDTAYMEDVYEKSRGGSGARLSAAGADDNYSATATLLQAAPIFLRLAAQNRLACDIWLLHLTGEEFPSDCLGARHFCQALIENTLQLRVNHERFINLSSTRIRGVFVLDMIAHNRDKGVKDVFQISPGRGADSLRLAYQAHVANRIWNASVDKWNTGPERRGKGRGNRSQGGSQIPNTALHPRLHGEVRTLDDPHSSLYNTDAQIFSDAGLPVVLFMENYDISRAGYHDTRDTMENIDLDFGAALSAIAIETVARFAMNSRSGHRHYRFRCLNPREEEP